MATENLRDLIVDNIFDSFTFIERVKYVSNGGLLPVKVEVLKRETNFCNTIIQTLIQKGTFSHEDLNSIKNDGEIQKSYGKFLEKVQNAEGNEGAQALQTEFVDSGLLVMAGFFEFYQKYWEEKLGQPLY